LTCRHRTSGEGVRHVHGILHNSRARKDDVRIEHMNVFHGTQRGNDFQQKYCEVAPGTRKAHPCRRIRTIPIHASARELHHERCARLVINKRPSNLRGLIACNCLRCPAKTQAKPTLEMCHASILHSGIVLQEDSHTSFSTFMHEYFKECLLPVHVASAAARNSEYRSRLLCGAWYLPSHSCSSGMPTESFATHCAHHLHSPD